MNKRERLGSRLGFIMLSAGCAIGCGNVWKFPWMCGQNGGGGFVLIYLLCLLLLGLPVMLTLPHLCALTIGLPVAVINLILNALPTMALRYNTPMLLGMLKRMRRKAVQAPPSDTVAV